MYDLEEAGDLETDYEVNVRLTDDDDDDEVTGQPPLIMAGHEHRFGRRVLEPDGSYGIVIPVAFVECHLAHCREDLSRGADRNLRGFLGGEDVDQQVEELRETWIYGGTRRS